MKSEKGEYKGFKKVPASPMSLEIQNPPKGAASHDGVTPIGSGKGIPAVGREYRPKGFKLEDVKC